MLQDPVEVFRSARRRACDDRAFMLTAVGIDNDLVWDDAGYAVRVEGVALAHARHHLAQYEQERRRLPLPEPEVEAWPHAWRGTAWYALLLLLPPLVVSQGWAPHDLYAAGVMSPERMQSGEWWRAVTALTLHWDAPHLLGNLGAGVLLGHSAAQLLGNARAWLLVLLAATAANLVEGAGGGAHYVSAGASTAVFATLGLVAAYAWRTRATRSSATPKGPAQWLRRWAPLLAGVVLLGMFGAGESQPEPGFAPEGPTNVLSHLLGFVAGVAFGVLAAVPSVTRALARLPAWLAVAVTVSVVAVAWMSALWRAVMVG